MADKKISQLTAAATPLAGTEVLPIVQIGNTVKVSAADITAGRNISASGLTLSGGTAKGVLYLSDPGKVVTSGSDFAYTATGVGIGTATPSAKLQVFAGGVVARFGAFGTTTYDDVEITSYATENSIGTRGATPLTLNTNSSERLRILATGGVSIGNGEISTSPANALVQATGGSGTDIAGGSLTLQGGRGTGSGAGGAVVVSTAAAGASGTSLNSATARLTVSSAGNVTVNTGNIAIGTSGKGIVDTNGNESLMFTATASAVNELTIANAATGNRPVISATGGDTNIGIALTPKGSGDVAVTSGNVVIGTAAKGIDFSANTHAAGMTSELLNWYEEGSFTPAYGTTGSAPTITYLVQVGNYVRIGRMVYFSVELTTTARSGGSGNITITGLPFTAGSSRYVGGATSTFWDGWTTAAPIVGYVYQGNTKIDLQVSGATTSPAAPIGNLTNGTVYLTMYGSYLA